VTVTHAPASAPFDVAALRAAEFPHVGPGPYLNAASLTPTPLRTQRAVDEYNRRRVHIHELWNAGAESFDRILERARDAAARLVGADADEIALVPNTSYGINLAAQILPVPAGSRIVLSAWEFPANVYPWMQRAREAGAELVIVPADALGRPDEDRVMEELDRGGVSVFAVSAVQFATGWRTDLVRLGRFCRERGIRFVVDGIQALGQVPIDVREAEIDVLATGGQKWLCAPFGTGFAYVRRELASSLEPAVVGWTAMESAADYARVVDYRWGYVGDARRFEVATQPMQDVAGLAASIGLLLEVGVERIREHLREILDPLARFVDEREGLERVSDWSPERGSGIFCVRPRDLDAVSAALQRAGVVCVPREGAVRLSPHLYNTAEEIARVMEVLDGVVPR
jgi:selenocysteine lyase/cysteine desulfurase